MINKAKIKSRLNDHQDLIRILRFSYNAIKRPHFLQRKVNYGEKNTETVI